MKTKSVIEERLEELVTELEVLPADALDEDIRMGERRRDRPAGCTQIEHGWMLEPDALREIAASGMYFGNPIDLLSGTTRRTPPGTTASPTTPLSAWPRSPRVSSSWRFIENGREESKKRGASWCWNAQDSFILRHPG